MSNPDPQLVRENQRREDLNRQAKAGRETGDSKWLTRDEALTRGFGSPDGGR